MPLSTNKQTNKPQCYIKNYIDKKQKPKKQKKEMKKTYLNTKGLPEEELILKKCFWSWTGFKVKNRLGS